MIGSSTDNASGNLRVTNNCEACLYAFEISGDGFLSGDLGKGDDDSCWEIARELFPVVIVTVDELDELFIIKLLLCRRRPVVLR